MSRHYSADNYTDIRHRQDELFGREPVGQPIPSPSDAPDPHIVDWADLPKDTVNRLPCHCATNLCRERKACIKEELDRSQWYCTGRLPKAKGSTI